jgi:predicted  nucleic acid-binding Zn-ribbon protein
VFSPGGTAARGCCWCGGGHFRYLLEVRGADERGVLDAIATDLNDRGSTMQTIAQWLEERGEQRGQQIGQQIGQQLGKKLGQQALLLRLLRRGFGELPAPVVARVEAADEPTLERWADQLLTADTLAAVFA